MFNLGTSTPRLTGAAALYVVPFLAVALLLITGPGPAPLVLWTAGLILLACTALALMLLAQRRPSKRQRITWLVAGLTGMGWLWTLAALWLAPANRDLLTAVLVMVLLGTVALSQPVRLRALGFAALSYLFFLMLSHLFGPTTFDPRAELARGIVVALALLAAAVLGRAYTDMEQRLHARDESLKQVALRLTRTGQRDVVTQTYNRRFLFEILYREKSRADRLRRSFSIALLDIDHFRRVTDEYGHASGDRLLRAFAKRLKTNLRGSDWAAPGRVLGRFGAEEFLLLLPETALQPAQCAVDRLRREIAGRPFAAGVELTISAGIAEYRLGDSLENTLKHAQRALYLAQQWGRNRVEVDPNGGGELMPSSRVVCLEEHRSRKT